jgi:succinate-semialdehyde dehydrogenase/glutarate-semialdehyde dehydrogenase
MNTPHLTGFSHIASINPATGQVLRQFEPHPDAEVQRRLHLAAQTFPIFKSTSIEDRGRLLIRVAELLEGEKRELARTMTLEMGKPLGAAVQEAEKCVKACRFYAENAAGFLADEPVPTKDSRSYVRYEPLGPVLAIMPWNFPFWQVFRFAAPALMAGNVGLLKHASNVPQCALAIEDIFRRGGFPHGAFQILLIESNRVSEVIDDPRVRAVTLTGSVDAGSKVAAAAGRQIKKTVLELGGSDPFVVMPSTNLEQAVAAAVQARTINNGQSCIAAKRFIVDQRIADRFQEQFVQRMSALKTGDPMNEETQIGPLATESVAADLQQQVEQTIKLGAKLLLGGKRLDRPGFFFAPTVLTNIPPHSPAADDELFGPVASIFRTNGIDEAIQIANNTSFGLGASAWTNDKSERERFAKDLDAGVVFINGIVASDPLLPFGGTKRSGYGRELSHHGIREFVNIKTVVVKERDSAQPSTE